MVKRQSAIALGPPAPRRLANDLPPERDLLEAQKDTLWDFTDSGVQVWKEPQDEASKLTSNLRRVWLERGDFSQLKIEGIEKQKSKSASEAPDPKTNDEQTKLPTTSDQEELKFSETITVDELWEMRMKMAQQLGVMGGELSTGLDLLNVLLAPLAPDAVDATSLPLPAGGIAPTTHSHDHLPPRPEAITLIDSSVSLMRKRKAAQNASSILKRVAGELSREAKRSQNQWDALLQLREAGWNMRPRGVKPGADTSLIGRGAERAAKEVGISYATTEAAEALRASSFACIEPLSLQDGNTQFSLKLPPRPRRRLVITLVLPNQPAEHFSPWDRCSVQDIESLSFGENLELARAEVLEEEIFGEISKEAQSSTAYRTSTSDRAVTVKGFGPNAEICFEMLESDDETQASDVSSKGMLISALIRLLMVSIYRSRRQCASGIITTTTQTSQPKILEPLLDLIVFFLYTNNLQKLLLQAISDLKPTNLQIVGEFDSILESPAEIINLVHGNNSWNFHKLEVGGMATLRAMGRRLITFTISCPVVISLWLKDEPLKIGPDQIYSVLINEINQSIIDLLIEMIDSPKVVTKRVATGLVCQSTHKIFLKPTFKFGVGLNVKIETLSRHRIDKSKHSDVSQQEPITDYLGQIGLKEWLENLSNYIVE